MARVIRSTNDAEYMAANRINSELAQRGTSIYGEHGRNLLKSVWSDIAFISCNGWDDDKGITAPTEEKAALKKDLMNQAKTKVLLADSSKYGAWSLFHVGDLDSFTYIITDKYLEDDTKETLSKYSTKLIFAS